MNVSIHKIGMICFAKPILMKDFIVQKEEFSVTCYTRVIHTFDERTSIFIRDKPIFSSERMLHKDYNRKGSVEKNPWSWVSRGLMPKQTDWQ
jgi:hypothetical protein